VNAHRIRGLYAITPEGAAGEDLVALAEEALAGGAAILQYRAKAASAAERLATGTRLREVARRYGALCIVNDDVELALLLDADGVHLGRDDGALAVARARLGPQRLLGVSCYDSLTAARAAVAAGADYLAFGSVYASPTKPGHVRAPLKLFAEARALGRPLVAIGGITLENAPAVLAAGADALAVISALFDAPEVRSRARAFARLFLPGAMA